MSRAVIRVFSLPSRICGGKRITSHSQRCPGILERHFLPRNFCYFDTIRSASSLFRRAASSQFSGGGDLSTGPGSSVAAMSTFTLGIGEGQQPAVLCVTSANMQHTSAAKEKEEGWGKAVTEHDDEASAGGVDMTEEEKAVLRKEHSKALNFGCCVHRDGITLDEMVDEYTKGAELYDASFRPPAYNGPRYVADFLAEYFPEKHVRSEVKVVDIGAGSGIVGEYLSGHGFTQLDALEPSKGMLEILQKKGHYSGIIQELISDQPTSIPADHYDCLVNSGAFGGGHLPVFAVDEMIRIVKPGGLILTMMREEYLMEVDAYKDKLEPYMELCERQGLWKLVARTRVKNYSFGNTGVLFQHRVL